MCSNLKQIYDKKSPIFIAEIVVFIAAFIIYTDYECRCLETLPTLYLIILLISGIELISKSIVLAAIHAFNK